MAREKKKNKKRNSITDRVIDKKNLFLGRQTSNKKRLIKKKP